MVRFTPHQKSSNPCSQFFKEIAVYCVSVLPCLVIVPKSRKRPNAESTSHLTDPVCGLVYSSSCILTDRAPSARSMLRCTEAPEM